MATSFKTRTGENVDFDFFSTPRAEESYRGDSPESNNRVYYKPPPFVKQPKHGEDIRASDSFSAGKKDKNDSDSSDSDLTSDIETESNRSQDYKRSDVEEDRKKKKKIDKKNYSSESSSSAYTDSDSSSDDESKIIERERIRNKKSSSDSKYNRPSDKDIAQNRHSNSKEAWGSGIEKVEIVNKIPKESDYRYNRPKSGKYNKVGRGYNNKSGSDSEMTDVSPLPSPREKGDHENVQYDSLENGNGEVKLESKKLDLSILMEAVSEIDSNNRQQRLKNNTRRVMFEPRPASKSKLDRSNYSFDHGRVKMIEKENQRLLNEIMKHIGPKKKSSAVGKKTYKPTSPIVQRATPSAINRQRDQRRIEEENMAFLRRLQGTRPTRGMSRNEQISNYQQTVLHGIPIAAMHDAQSTLNGSVYNQTPSRLGNTQGSLALSTGRRSRPSSAKSNASSIRSRPSSAKSNASIVSRACSVKSNRSTVSNRPAWNDRFAYT